MDMERRWGVRKSIEVDVVIDNQPNCLQRGRIGDVSIGGLFVRTEPAGLAMNSQVELVLMLQQKDGTRVYRMPAMVARLTANGAGFMFDQYDVNAFRTLVVLLLARQKSSHRPEPHHRHSRLPLSIEDGARAAPIREGTTGKVATAAAPAVPVLPPLSPICGESH